MLLFCLNVVLVLVLAFMIVFVFVLALFWFLVFALVLLAVHPLLRLLLLPQNAFSGCLLTISAGHMELRQLSGIF